MCVSVLRVFAAPIMELGVPYVGLSLLEAVLDKALIAGICALGGRPSLEVVLACFFQVPGGAHSTWNHFRQN